MSDARTTITVVVAPGNDVPAIPVGGHILSLGGPSDMMESVVAQVREAALAAYREAQRSARTKP